jgi:hypothetical protein
MRMMGHFIAHKYALLAKRPALARILAAIAVAAIAQGCTVTLNNTSEVSAVIESITSSTGGSVSMLTSFTGAGTHRGGAVENITWSTASITGVTLAANPVALSYSTDNGSTWTPIATGEANDGSYAWTLPSIDSSAVRVRIAVTDIASAEHTDSSSASFSIDSTAPSSPTLTVNGGASGTHFLAAKLNMAATESVSTPVQACVSANNNCAGCTYGAVAFGSSVDYSFTGGAGVKDVSAKYRDAVGNESACVSASIAYNQTLTVTHRFDNARHWNDYARRCAAGNNLCSGMPARSAAACDGTETGGANACVHGGERREVATEETSCTGLTLTDALGAFDWKCSIQGGVATFHSILKPSKGLADLVTHGSPTGSWKSNSVTLVKGAENLASASSAWWDTTNNPVHELPDNSATCPNPGADPAWTCSADTAILGATGTVYTLSATRSTQGYNIDADKVSLVTIGSGTVLTGGVASANCVDNSMEYGAASASRCLVSIGSERFVWVEGRYFGTTANQPTYIIALKDVSFSQFRRASAGHASQSNLYMVAGTSYNRFSQFKSEMTDNGPGIYVLLLSLAGRIKGNVFWDINASSSPIDGISITSDVDYNVFSNVVSSKNGAQGIQLRGNQFAGTDSDQKLNTFSRLTLADNRASALTAWTDGGSPVPNLVIHNAVASGNGNSDYAFSLIRSVVDVARPTLSQIAIANNLNASGGIRLDGVSNGKLTGNLLVGNNATNNCSVNSGTNPGMSSVTQCAATDASDHNLVTGITLASSYVYRVTSDAANSVDTAGLATGANLLNSPADLFNFDNFFRHWGITNADAWPSAGLNGRCFPTTNDCHIYDRSLLAAANVIRNTTGNGATANSSVTGGACPVEASGNAYLTTATYTYDAEYFSGLNGVETAGGDSDGVCESGETCVQRYLSAATETFGDDIGDEDGLCETGEACLYTPNFGAYQGHGTLSECAFTDGTVTGVTMSYYGTNGY